jgi:hypothetical protein
MNPYDDLYEDTFEIITIENINIHNKLDLSVDLKKNVLCIEPDKIVKPIVEMSSKKQRRNSITEHTGITIAVNNQENIEEKDKEIAVMNGKRIKITHLMIESAYKKLRVFIDTRKVDAESIATIAAYALQISNDMLNTSKTYKVELALAIIRKLVDDEVEDSDQRVIIHMLIESTMPELIKNIPGMISKLFSCCKTK